MLISNGEKQLKEFTLRSYKESVTQITEKVWHVLGMGHSNAIFIEGNESVILIDTLDTLERGQKLLALIESKTDKPVKTILYTHRHPDHRGGAGAFSSFNPEIIAFTPTKPLLAKTEMINDILNLRSVRQFGYTLNDDENISQGIGIREGIAYGEQRAFAAPTTIYNKDEVIRNIDGITLHLIRLPGETDDQMTIWLPDLKILCCGDNYYGCWPNLYAIRGSQYRDIASWIKSLDALLSYQADYLLPGHTAPLYGSEEIQRVLGTFRNSIASILEQTLIGMNNGMDMDTLATEVKLPPEYADLPFLGEYYGCVDWTVRAIFTGYAGWFDGNPTKLHPLAPKEHADKTIALMGGAPSVLQAIQNALENKVFQWCLELCDLLLSSQTLVSDAKSYKAAALRGIAACETSANGRHYYLVCAKELEEKD